MRSATGITVALVGLLCLIATQLPAQQEPRLRRGFREITLGAPFAEISEAVAADTAFMYRGEPDVTLRMTDGERVIDTRGRSFVDRGIFQFQQDVLYTFSLYLNRQRLDWFQLYEQLRARYGEPDTLDPRQATWEDEFTRITLERPLTVHYLDRATFEQLRADRLRLEAAEDVARDSFLEEF